MSVGFTKGPWFAVPTTIRWHGARAPIFDDGLWHIHEEADPEKCEIASIDRGDDHDPPTRKQAEANARLIAAAPTMYEALEVAERALRDAHREAVLTIREFDGGEICCTQYSTAADLASDALAKAAQS